MCFTEQPAQLARIFHRGLETCAWAQSARNSRPQPRSILPDGQTITLEPVVRHKHRIGLKDFDPCTILLNKRFVSRRAWHFEDLPSNICCHPLHAGWYVRRKKRALSQLCLKWPSAWQVVWH